ncbi:exportin [Anaeramoeba ignava]|uniref:Exportin n=1 Tax=Anaeramoeba ignava TaxID=1746090 RepID=A0A9Q0RBB4_ANAIG|nr:exportin [Anaeramoeba ignava]
MVSLNKIQTPLFNVATEYQQNEHYLKLYLLEMLAAMFPHLNQPQIENFIAGMFELNKDLPNFKNHLRDFLIQLKEFTGQDNTDLFEEEKQLQKQQDFERRKQIPGFINPYEQHDDENDNDNDNDNSINMN